MLPYKLLTLAEAATILGVSRIRMHQFCREGRIGHKIAGRWLIIEDELRLFRQIPRPRGNPNFGKKMRRTPHSQRT